MKIKSIVIGALICLNLGLLTALVFIQPTGEAEAQNTYFRESNYVMVAGQIETGYEVIYVIDMATQRLGAWKFDRTDKRLEEIPGRELKTDFRGR